MIGEKLEHCRRLIEECVLLTRSMLNRLDTYLLHAQWREDNLGLEPETPPCYLPKAGNSAGT